jgi:hypothetical protein
MGLRAQAAADLQAILEDGDGFGWPITIATPYGVEACLTGLSTDVSQTIDPETGQAISGRVASVALSLARLEALSLGIPKGTADEATKPWRITFDDVLGHRCVFIVREAHPDRALGIVTCTLETFDEGE